MKAGTRKLPSQGRELGIGGDTIDDDDDNDDADDTDNKEQYDDFGNDNGGRLKGIVLPDLVKVMKWAEKNPVVSAFGMWNSNLGRRTIDFKRTIRVHQQLQQGISEGGGGKDKVLGSKDKDGEREEEEEGDFRTQWYTVQGFIHHQRLDYFRIWQ